MSYHQVLNGRKSVFLKLKNLPRSLLMKIGPIYIFSTPKPFTLLHLTRPNPHNPILPPLSQIPILNLHPLHTSWAPPFLLGIHTSAAIPMPAICFIVDFGYGLACCGDDAARVEHHACYWVVISVGIVDGAGAEIPYLNRSISRYTLFGWGGMDLLVYSGLDSQSLSARRRIGGMSRAPYALLDSYVPVRSADPTVEPSHPLSHMLVLHQSIVTRLQNLPMHLVSGLWCAIAPHWCCCY